ncbi:MAG: hypothetical protein ACRDLS_08295 [Solirubrobacteraceae bacterium]
MLDLGGTVGVPDGTSVERDDPVSTSDVVGLARRALERLRSR